ncbi:MAG: hypothetical protein E6R05_05580 [Candidatus Moraniibacteriota bacterium]|nr:MAG: hypothetical protein E6R05_05580 [Candidatus Moranbacteria bacterium]
MSEKIRFQIESLQRTKIIMAVEAVAVNTSVMLGIYLVNRFFDETLLTTILILIGGLFGIVYALYASLGNAKRHVEIRKLEKMLD